MTKFKEQVIKIVSLIPKGKVASYGQVALYVGMPRAARQVGWILNGLEEKIAVPWWRIVNNQGRISIKGSKYSAVEQKALLIQEGIEVRDDMTFDIEKYRYNPDEKFIKKLRLGEAHIYEVLPKIGFSRLHNKG